MGQKEKFFLIVLPKWKKLKSQVLYSTYSLSVNVKFSVSQQTIVSSMYLLNVYRKQDPFCCFNFHMRLIFIVHRVNAPVLTTSPVNDTFTIKCFTNTQYFGKIMSLFGIKYLLSVSQLYLRFDSKSFDKTDIAFTGSQTTFGDSFTVYFCSK